MSRPTQRILIVGAGIVGIATSALLSEQGHAVTVIDRTGIAEETSKGNAAALAFSDIMPLASPKILLKAPKWLLDPLGPLSIRPSYLPRLAPWLWQFWKASLPARLQTSIATQTALMRLAEAEMMALVERAGIGSMVRHDGSLELYESEAEFKASADGWARRAKAGIGFEHVRGNRLADLQPGLSPRFEIGTFVPGWKTVSEPQRFALALWAHSERHGAVFEKAEVRALERPEQGPAVRLADGTARHADRIVVCAGAWSTRLINPLTRLRIPLDTERGYNTTLPPGAFDLKRQLIFGNHGFVVTPLDTGVRVGGAVELGGLDLPPNYARSRSMLGKAAEFLPGLKTSGGVEWMGFRPSLPDSLPVIGALPGDRSILLAFGNGHLGLTQSAAMGRLVADLVADKAPSIDIAACRPDRF
ncbi:MAG: FAD-dependent oxidoreductase [Hoeflea sp.]|uniref:NAD(P)/FAD-dependent oxidoreductase n=1 Tax=Hoeflea sp. TaxID=1940281 RepID=UPI001D407370|nr:FAD-dependent oxidoreductase [Hoeflea sp.]MBU4528162.1 FAD-dependent oxidoreductase [Alphaproteobacteria bacterium]MBU4543758.1 FAD-dependent oxidoreductase [Alphaproteobacteria bacterium]MBU4548625.1 FAD-dependent oxidoreductase [Alphaproteobacteria bacterium]MBV1725791.1 FAD-dependent oxidoreductase [Hoeflea sp.]MBV1762147.1 FAD-dependent oxidoreductase [Hoeflea sp.]